MAGGDTAHWLQNKLGPTDDLWSGISICAQLNLERLQSIQECFHSLLPHVKVKLLLSFLHLPRRNIEQWREDLNFIVQGALADPDAWVVTVAEIVRQFPDDGILNMQLHTTSPTFAEILADLRNKVKESSGARLLPLECQYLSKPALTQTAGNVPPPVKYFSFKRKPKSAALRADVISKSYEVASNKKKNVSNSVPIKSRSFLKKMDTTTPMKGIPSRAPPSSTFRSTPSSSKITGPSVTVTPLGNTWVTNRPGVNRKEGGVKFLEIGEQPVGAREAKKRKRQAELEAMEQQKKAKVEAAAAAAAAATPTTAPQPSTPDYAAGLMAPATPKMPTPMLSTTASLTVQGPSYVPSTARTQTVPTTAATLGGVGALSTQQQARKNLHTTLQNSLVATTVVRPAVTVTSQAVTAVVATAKPTIVTATTTGTVPTAQPTTIIVQASPQLLKQQAQAGQKLVATQVRLPAGVQVKGQTGVVGAQAVQVRLTAPTVTPAQAQQQQQQQQQQPQLPQQQQLQQQPTLTTVAAPAPQQPKKGLSLTRDQMMEAQEMFRVSNKVSRPEKALILGFMAGSRENPCPQQGNVLNIKLSENEETVAQPDGTQKTVIVDTYFQMNYGSGEWKRFKKYRASEVS